MEGAAGHGVAPRRFSLPRRALFRSVEWICTVLGGRHFYRWRYLSDGRLRVRREMIDVARWPAGMQQITIAHLTDFHGGSYLKSTDLAGVVDRTNRLEPDLVALTGDFLTHRTEEALELVRGLGGLRAKLGMFAVFGNHDYRGRREGEIEAALAAVGVTTLRNRNRAIAPGLFVAGVEDLEEGKHPDFDRAFEGIGPSDIVILLSHHPGGLGQGARRGAVLVLSGHTHGNQVQWPVLRRLGPRHPGDRIQSDGTTLIVSHGIGAIGIPLRVGAAAEIVFATLRRPGSLAATS